MRVSNPAEMVHRADDTYNKRYSIQTAQAEYSENITVLVFLCVLEFIYGPTYGVTRMIDKGKRHIVGTSDKLPVKVTDEHFVELVIPERGYARPH